MAKTTDQNSKKNKFDQFQKVALTKQQQKHLKGGDGGDGNTSPDEENPGVIGSDDIVGL